MNWIPLPTEVEAYFLALRENNAKAVALCFQEHAIVKDEGREHTGQAAIELWMAEALKKYSLTAEPLAVKTEGPLCKVQALVSGQFPGSPIPLQHLFLVEDGKFTSLEVVSA